MSDMTEDYDQLPDRVRQDRDARINMYANGGDDMAAQNKIDESGYIQLSYTEYNRIQQKKIDSSSNETMFR